MLEDEISFVRWRFREGIFLFRGEHIRFQLLVVGNVWFLASASVALFSSTWCDDPVTNIHQIYVCVYVYVYVYVYV